MIMDFETRLTALDDMCKDMAEVLIQNRLIIEQYQRYEQRVKDIKEQYSDIMSDLSPEFLEKQIEQKMGSMTATPMNPKYVTSEQKDVIWNQMVEGKDKISFEEMNRHLSSRHIQGKAALFFRHKISKLETMGGNKKRYVLLKEEDNATTN
jgi:hypothetical protein